MRSILVFAIYVLENWKLSVTHPKWLRDPLGGHDPPVGNRCGPGLGYYQDLYSNYCICERLGRKAVWHKCHKENILQAIRDPLRNLKRPPLPTSPRKGSSPVGKLRRHIALHHLQPRPLERSIVSVSP